MPGTARRLARRYLPPAVRKRLRTLRRALAGAPAKQPAGRKTAQQPHHATLIDALRTGAPLADALLRQIRSLLAAGEPHTASSIAASLRKDPE
jgi:hypothetical protein